MKRAQQMLVLMMRGWHLKKMKMLWMKESNSWKE